MRKGLSNITLDLANAVYDEDSLFFATKSIVHL